jgi:hypothetical protein
MHVHICIHVYLYVYVYTYIYNSYILLNIIYIYTYKHMLCTHVCLQTSEVLLRHLPLEFPCCEFPPFVPCIDWCYLVLLRRCMAIPQRRSLRDVPGSNKALRKMNNIEHTIMWLSCDWQMCLVNS